MTQGVSTFVTGPSGQQVILGPSAAAALFDQTKQTPARPASSSQQQQQQQQQNGYAFPSTTGGGESTSASGGMNFSTVNSMNGSKNTVSNIAGGGAAVTNTNTNIKNEREPQQQNFLISKDTAKGNDVPLSSSSATNKSSKRKVDSSSVGAGEQGVGGVESISFEQQQQRSKSNYPQQQQWRGGGGDEAFTTAPTTVSDSYYSSSNNNNISGGDIGGLSQSLPSVIGDGDMSVSNSTTLGHILQNSMMMPNSQHPRIGSSMDSIYNEKFKPGDRRRQERNLREQARSHKISQQIKALRDVLSDSKVPFKANKYSILTSVADYIKQLQSHAVLLDGEHKKLINTIRKTTEMVNSGSVPQVSSSSGGGNISSNNGNSSDTCATNNEGSNDLVDDAEMLLVQGLDYRTLFNQCSAALGVVALDGRFLACNAEFQNIIGYTKEQLEKHSLFDLLANKDADEFFGILNDVFNKRKDMEACGDSNLEEKENVSGVNEGLWSGIISRPQQSFQVNITVTRTTQGTPKFFNCALFEASNNVNAEDIGLEI